MKKTIDISDELQELHNLLSGETEPTEEELASVKLDPKDTIEQANKFLNFVKEQQALQQQAQTLTVQKAANDETPLAEFKLLSAGKKESSIKWHEQLITVGGVDGRGGCLLEIATRAKTNQVNITLSAQANGEALLQALLADYAGGELDINITFKNKVLLEAHIRVAEDADIARGRGVLFDSERPDTKDESAIINIINKKDT
ncbi:hypothetical protein ACOI22_00535 [Glaciecola sp. 2405UD65-10]|uniref:hypothetical protein n=1 Tax=Glaciecola sp. 2405UD65-10 TaxID=3397244 RepID=UPI003B5A0DCA